MKITNYTNVRHNTALLVKDTNKAALLERGGVVSDQGAEILRREVESSPFGLRLSFADGSAMILGSVIDLAVSSRDRRMGCCLADPFIAGRVGEGPPENLC